MQMGQEGYVKSSRLERGDPAQKSCISLPDNSSSRVHKISFPARNDCERGSLLVRSRTRGAGTEKYDLSFPRSCRRSGRTLCGSLNHDGRGDYEYSD